MKQCTIVAFGDSLTYGYGVLSHIAYPARLARQLPQQEPALSWHVYNSGINGETTREALRRLEQSVLRHRPQIVCVLLGSNDSALNEGQYRTPWEYEQNMSQIIERILASAQPETDFNGGCSLPLLLTPPPVIDTDFYPFTTTDRIELYSNIVRKLGESYHCPVADLFSAFLQKKEDAETYEALFQYDGVHLSNAGYDVLYELLEKKLLELLRSPIEG